MPSKSVKRTKEQPQKSSRLYDVFVGTTVQIMVKLTKESEDGVMSSIAIEGYLLDEDDEYYYVGTNPIEIAGAVKKSEVAVVMSSEPSEYELPEGTQVN